jgi:hypothetical protein
MRWRSFVAAVGPHRHQQSSTIIDGCPFGSIAAQPLSDCSNTQQYKEQLVRSHMRMLYSVRQNQHVMVTGSSPEPLLAEAARSIRTII